MSDVVESEDESFERSQGQRNAGRLAGSNTTLFVITYCAAMSSCKVWSQVMCQGRANESIRN